MRCEAVRTHLLDLARRRLDPALHAELATHLESCAACRAVERVERATDELLEQRLPRYGAPSPLKRRLGLIVDAPAPERRARARWTRAALPLAAMAASVVLVAGVLLQQRSATRRSAIAMLTSEAVNDHLRVLVSQHPLDVQSGGTHQVKPWFEGRLDFAPVVPAPEVSDLQLRGGSVGYVFDRKAAVLVYSLRLHVVTLLVFPPEGIAWPGAGALQLGSVRGSEASARGFNVMLWRHGDLGYALVSDVGPEELRELAARFAGAMVRERGP